MYVAHLSVADFRSWPRADLAFEPGASVLVGANGQGKTNLLEAIGYLATLSSHRVASDAPLVRAGAERAIVQAAVVSGGRQLVLEVEITPGRANKAKLNRSPVPRPRDILGGLRTVLFAPEDLAIVRGDPSERRRFLDEVLVMRVPRLAGVRADYDRILKQRNTLLKSAAAARRGGDLSTLEVWDEHLATTGAAVLSARLALVTELRPYVAAAYADLAPSSAPVDVAYRSSAGDITGMVTESELREALLAEIAQRRPAELDRGISLVGPHRDELELVLGPGVARGYASHGESWSFALALRIGSFELLRSDGVDPVLVLDDVFAELDVSRRTRLAGLVADADQVLITAAVDDDVPAVLTGRHLRIAAGMVVPERPGWAQ